MTRRPVLAALAASALICLGLAPPASAGQPKSQYLVSLGDSYAVGYQADVRTPTRNGPADQLVPLARRRGHRLQLVNFACGGATTTSLVSRAGCPARGRAPGAPAYDGQTQVEAAAAFIRRNRGRIGLVTMSISGNDVTPCIPRADRLPCVREAMTRGAANIRQALRALRRAGGRRMRIVGSTYPNVVLGAWVREDVFGAGRFGLATDSLTAFAEIINPTLRRTYRSVGGKFVDVTRATGAYGPFTTEETATYGRIPTPVAKVCRLTYFCSNLDIHMTTAGYRIIARLEAATLPRRR